MADVIFSGTDSRSAVGMAEVSLTFSDCAVGQDVLIGNASLDELADGSAAVIDAMDAHRSMSEQALSSKRVQEGLKDILLGRVCTASLGGGTLILSTTFNASLGLPRATTLLSMMRTSSVWRRTPVLEKIERRCARAVLRRIFKNSEASSSDRPLALTACCVAAMICSFARQAA